MHIQVIDKTLNKTTHVELFSLYRCLISGITHFLRAQEESPDFDRGEKGGQGRGTRQARFICHAGKTILKITYSYLK